MKCEGCERAFVHPAGEHECGSIEGKCEHLMRARWVPVWVRVEHDHQALFIRGGWLCIECRIRYGGAPPVAHRKVNT